MKVLVVGAAGRTGQAVVEHALADGHEVTAFVHSQGYDVAGVAVHVGDASDVAAMGAAVAGQDAVVDTIAGKTPYKHSTLETGTATSIVTAMQQHGVRRLVVTSVVGEGDSIANTPFSVKIMMKTFLRGSTKDKAGMEAVVRASGLDWVITRPSFLKQGPATGDARVFSPKDRQKASSTTRADLGAFIVDQLTSDEHLGRAVTLANP